MGHVGGAFELEDGEVRFLVAQEHSGRIFLPVVQHHADVGGLSHDMVIRHHDPVLRQDHAGAEGVLDPGSGLALEVAEKVAEDRVVGEGAAVPLHDTAGVDVNHRGGGLFHERREAEGNLGLALRHLGLGEGGLGQNGGQAEQQDAHGEPPVFVSG